MNVNAAQELFRRFACSMAYVAVENQDGTQGIGSAFHVGDGIFVTARHVVENTRILEVVITEPLRLPVEQVFPHKPEPLKLIGQHVREVDGIQCWGVPQEPLKLELGPLFHSDPKIDVATFKVCEIHPSTPYVSLGSHLDDWIEDDTFMLSEAIILGYPPIPLTPSPYLVAARAEVNAVIDPYHAKKVHFVLSATPRGGFSGGIALSEHGFVLGVITEALCFDGKPPETGFFAVLSIEGIYECLSHHKLLPECQEKGWDDFWNLTSTDIVRPGFGRQMVGKGDETFHIVLTVREFDNGRRFYVEVLSEEVALLDLALASISATLDSTPHDREQVREGWVRVLIKPNDRDSASEIVKKNG
jgi:hypothetical protein